MNLIPVSVFFVIGCSSSANFSNLPQNNVTDQGTVELKWSPEVLLYTGMLFEEDAGVAQNRVLTLENTGDSSLKIDTIQIVSTQENEQQAQFFVGTDQSSDLSIAAGRELDVTVVASLSSNSAAFAETVIRSNDTENRVLRIPLCAYPEGSTTTPCPVESIGDTGE